MMISHNLPTMTWCTVCQHVGMILELCEPQNVTQTFTQVLYETKIYFLVVIRLKKKFCVSKAAACICFSVRIWFCKIQTFIFFFLKLLFFFIFTTKNQESLLFWKNLSTWELKKRVKSCLISENTEVETFQSYLVSDVRGGKGQWK